MADKRAWFITGAGRGMGVDITQAALAAGHAVAATGRNTAHARRSRRGANSTPFAAHSGAGAELPRHGQLSLAIDQAAMRPR